MRDLVKVIDKMIEIIPENNNTLILQLKNLQGSVLFSAPELMKFRWEQCAEILNDNISGVTEDWQKELQKVFSGTIKA
jgi:ribosomal protein L6P/L9E